MILLRERAVIVYPTTCILGVTTAIGFEPKAYSDGSIKPPQPMTVCLCDSFENYSNQRQPFTQKTPSIMAPPTLVDLPSELLLELPQHMRNIEDFLQASSCRRLRSVFAGTPTKTILHLASRSAPTFFSPHPDFLTLATARQVAHWVAAAPETRTERFIQAFRGGVGGILDLALCHEVVGVGLSMADIRGIYEKRFSVINPLNATLDAMIGDEWYRTPNFWDGGVTDAFTFHAEVEDTTMQLLLYGELFGPKMESFLKPYERIPRLSVDVRIEFIKYCIPDWVCGPNHGRVDVDFEVFSVGPFAGALNDEWSSLNVSDNQTALCHLVGGAMFVGALWKMARRRVLIAARALENEDGKWPDS